MIGTPRQVRWASSVRAEKMRDIEPELAAWEARGENVDAIRLELDEKSATWWLDRRDDKFTALIGTAARDAANRAPKPPKRPKALPVRVTRLLERCAALNPAAGEIGAGMLATLQSEAAAILEAHRK